MDNPRIWRPLEIGTNVTVTKGAKLRAEAKDDGDVLATTGKDITKLAAVMISENKSWYAIDYLGRIVFVNASSVIPATVRYYPIEMIDQALTVVVNDILRRVVAGIPDVVIEGNDA